MKLVKLKSLGPLGPWILSTLVIWLLCYWHTYTYIYTFVMHQTCRPLLERP